MRLSIRHVTTYLFLRPVAFNPHRLMLRPRSDADLDVLAHSLEIRPQAELVWSTDVFGNLLATASFSQLARELVVDSRLIVETTAPVWPVYPIEPRAQCFPFSYAADEASDLGALRDANRHDASVAEWAQGFLAGPATDTLCLLKDLNEGVHSAIGYEARCEENTQSAAETLSRRAGACRDFAELFLACVRSLGFAGRAVSGYLADPERTGGGDAAHAWAEVYVPGPGWIAFDPTNGRLGAAGLIKVAVARASAQALPIIGSYTGTPGDHLGLEVQVTAAECAAEQTGLVAFRDGSPT